MFREYKLVESTLDMLRTMYMVGGVNDIHTIVKFAKDRLGRDISVDYVNRTFRKLSKMDILHGHQTGYTFAKDPSEIKMGKIMRLFAVSTEDQSLFNLEQMIFKSLDNVSLKEYLDNAY
jgi:DNA-binding IscR family transcriptional regulator